MSSNNSTFEQFLANLGFEPDYPLDDGGRVVRFSGPDERRHKKSAWYWYVGEAGVVGDWRTGEKHHWRDDAKVRLNWENKDKDRIARLKALSIERYNDMKFGHVQASRVAHRMWAESDEITSVIEHKYLQAKQILPHNTRKFRDMLLVPIFTAHTMNIINLQCIFPDGQKRFLKGGEVEGGFYRIGFPVPKRKRVHICEGFATAATVNQLTGHPAVVAFNAGNLLEVASVHRQFNPIIVCDNDHKTVINGKHVNVGLDKGLAAAIALSLQWVAPFVDDESVTDFNDLAIQCGEDEAKKQLRQRYDATTA